MNKLPVTNREKRDPKRLDIYEEFLLWSALPPTERHKLDGIETQEQFAQYYKIGINTPTAWKRRNDYGMRVTALRKEWAFSKTGDVIESIYQTALKGNPASQKLWMQAFEGFSEGPQANQKLKPEITVNDIRFLIEALPEPLKTKHYMFLRELFDDCTAHANAQNINVQALETEEYSGTSSMLSPSMVH